MKERVIAHVKNIKESGIRKILFSHPLIKLIVFMLIQFALINYSGYFPKNFPIRWGLIVLNILIVIYFISLGVYMVRRSFTKLMNPKNLFSLIEAYAILLVLLLLTFSTLYSFVELSGLGYIKYGSCSGTFNPTMITTDPSISEDFFYFAAVTFFTVGYGDICPMGAAKLLSILVAFIGNIITVIVVALIINNYLRSKKKEE